MGTEVSEAPAGGNLPALAPTPAMDITAEDVALPRLKIGQSTSPAVQEGLVKNGEIFVTMGEDDPDPQVLWEPGSDDGLRLLVLNMYKGKSVSSDGELTLYDFHDPDAPPEAWTTYTYVAAIPAYDDTLPVKWMLTRSGKTVAQQINMVLKKTEAKGPAYLNAFEVTTVPKSNNKGKWSAPRVRPVEATEDEVKVAAALASMIAGSGTAEPVSAEPVDEPGI